MADEPELPYVVDVTEGDTVTVSVTTTGSSSSSDPGSIQKSLLTLKGDLIAASASATPVRLPAGASGRDLAQLREHRKSPSYVGLRA